MTLEIRQFPCLNDNYGFLLRDTATGKVATVDTPDPDAISREVATMGGRLDLILNTHHHPDHTGGNLALKARWKCTIVGPAREADRIPGLDRAVAEDDLIALGDSSARVIETPGHTSGHIIFYFEAADTAFVGDTLFALGCGRLFEGTPQQMWTSLQKIRALPDRTTLYCAHEYTEANARFAQSIEPSFDALTERADTVTALRGAGQPTVPTTLARELATNPFLRADDPRLAQALGMSDADPVKVFAETRRRKDHFTG